MSELQTVAISGSKIKVRWEEPYVSYAVNKQLSAMPRGVYRGGILAESVVPDTSFRLIVDDGTGLYTDTFFVYRDTTNLLSLAVTEDSDVVFDMSGEFGLTGPVTWYVWADVDYSTGVPTVGEYHVTDSAPPTDAIVFGKVVLTGSETVIQNANFSYVGRTYPEPTAREDGVYVAGDAVHGMLSGERAWNIPTSDQKRAMNAASPAPDAANPFVTKANTIDKILGEPIAVTKTLTGETKFLLTGSYYVGKATGAEATKYFRIVDSSYKAYPLLGSDNGVIHADIIYKSDGVTHLNPSADADAYGFYTNPQVGLAFKTSDIIYTGNLVCLCILKSDFASLPQSPSSAFPVMAQDKYDHAGLIRIKNISGTPQSLTDKTVQTALDDIVSWINARTRKASSEIITATWEHRNKLTVDVTGLPGGGGGTNAIEAKGKGDVAAISSLAETGDGVWGRSGEGRGVRAQGHNDPGGGGNNYAASFKIVPQISDPLVPPGGKLEQGDMWVRDGSNSFKIYLYNAIQEIMTSLNIRVPKSLGSIETGAAGPTVVSLVDSYNIGSLSYVDSDKGLKIEFSTNMASPYSVVFGLHGDKARTRVAQIDSKFSGYFVVYLIDAATGALDVWNVGPNMKFDFAVYGTLV